MIFQPPFNITSRDRNKESIFLAGTIDNNNSADWQKHAIKVLGDENWNIFNPRRSDWDSSWTPEFENAQFNQQVKWELNALEKADIILINFLADSVSPISLLELGLFIQKGSNYGLYVVSPPGFWRKGNVDIVCEQFDVPLFTDLDKALQTIKDNHGSISH